MTDTQTETVTISFIANFEVDPDQFDLRVRKPDKIRKEIFASVCSNGRPQQVCGNSDAGVKRIREKIKDARESNND